jgi:RWD domain
MDYAAEQAQELESLTYIYTPDELHVQDAHVSIAITLENGDQFTIRFNLPETYPDVVPEIELKDCELHQNDLAKLLEKCREQAVCINN